MGGIVLGILVWQEGGAYVGLLMGIGAVALAAFAFWLVRRKRSGKPTLLDPDLFKHLNFRIGVSQQMFQQITLGGAMIALPLFLQMTLEYNAMKTGLTLAPLSLSMFAMALFAGRKAGKRRPANIVLAGFALSTVGMAAIIPLVPRVDSGWYLVAPLVVTGAGLGLLVSQLNNFTLAPISEERVSEAAGVNSAGGSFGLSFGLAMAGGIMLWALALSFGHLTATSTVIPPAQQQEISAHLEHDAEVMSNTQLQKQIADEPQDVQNAFWLSTPRLATARYRWHSSFPPLLPSSGWATHSECAVSPTSLPPQTLKASAWGNVTAPLCQKRVAPFAGALGHPVGVQHVIGVL